MSGSTPLTIDGLNAMNDTMNSARDRAILITLCGTGLRVNELAPATIGDVLSGDRRMRDKLHIPAARVKGKRRARNVPLPFRVQSALATWIAVHPAPHLAAPLFPSQKGKDQPLTARQIQRIIKKAATAAGVEGKITPHSGRKYFGTQVYRRSGNDINITAKALAHSSIAATPAYLELNAEQLQRVSMSVFDSGLTPELSLDLVQPDTLPAPGSAAIIKVAKPAPQHGDSTPWQSPDSERTENF